MKNPTIVVPLGKGSKWENNELRYMLRSLEQHCQFDFEVVVFCTEKPKWLNAKVEIVERTYPEKVKKYYGQKLHYENYYDTIHKLQACIASDNVSDEFFYVYDDILLIEDLYLPDMKKVIAGSHYDNKPQFFDKPSNKWMNTLFQALEVCRRNSYPLYVYETHLPRYYIKSNLREMFKKHDPESRYIPYAVSTVYYNMFYDKPDDCYYENNKVKAGFYGGTQGNDCFMSNTDKAIEQAIKDKIWINYSDAGLAGNLKMWIEKRFPNKSKFEL